MLFDIIEVVHVIGAAVLFGTGLGTALYMVMANRTKDVAIIAKAATNVVNADWIFTGTAAVLQPITGFAMVYLKGYSLTAFWVWGSVSGYMIAGLFWLPVVYMQIRLRDMAIVAMKSGQPLPPRYYRIFRYWIFCGFPAFISLIGVFFLMVNGPASAILQ